MSWALSDGNPIKLGWRARNFKPKTPKKVPSYRAITLEEGELPRYGRQPKKKPTPSSKEQLRVGIWA